MIITWRSSVKTNAWKRLLMFEGIGQFVSAVETHQPSTSILIQGLHRRAFAPYIVATLVLG